MRAGWIMAGVVALTLVATARGEDVALRNAEGETPLQVALRETNTTEVVALLSDTQAAYLETFTRGPAPHLDPLPPAELDQAFAVLLGLVSEYPRMPQLNFTIGMLSVQRNDLARAELALERVLQAQPDNHRAGLELARVCMLSGQHEAARRYFEHVLSHSPPANVERNIESQLTDLNRLNKRFHLSARVDAGWISDDNVNVGPSTDLIQVFPIAVGSQTFTALAVAPASLPVEAEGGYAAAAIVMLFDGGRPSGWGLTADLNYFESWLDAEEHDTRLLQGGVGIKHAAKRGLFEGKLRAGRIWTGDDPLVDTIGLAPAYLRGFASAPRLHWISTALVEQRDYDTRDERDGIYLAAEQSLRLMLSKQASLFAGLRGAVDNADDSAFAYTGLSGVVGATATWGRLRLYTSARYTRNDYDTREVLAPEDRVDTQWLIDGRLTLQIVGNAGVELRQQYTDNVSTFDLYEYERNLTMIGLWGRF
ncbi:MAG: DUF560 domain-containing protein [Lentisphaerae bacterium]|nr:DUF560 domain-containing protein [Lentisphaerota bacterium]